MRMYEGLGAKTSCNNDSEDPAATARYHVGSREPGNCRIKDQMQPGEFISRPERHVDRQATDAAEQQTFSKAWHQLGRMCASIA